MSDPAPDFGGSPLLTVSLIGSGSIADRLVADLGPRVTEVTSGAIEVELRRPPADRDRPVTATRVPDGDAADVTLLVFDGDLPDAWPGLDEARTTATQAVVGLKSAGSRVISIGVATVDPTQTTTEARDVERTAHELNLLLLELSVAEGISILDVDRIVAQLGAQAHLTGFLEYDDAVLDAVVTQLVEILADYGFFEERPLLPQVGAKK